MRPKKCDDAVPVTLREFFEASIQLAQKDIAHERELREQQVSEQKEALKAAKETNDERLEGMNQLREQVNSERGRYVTREVWESGTRETGAKIEGLSSKIYMGIGIVIAIQFIIGIAVTVWTVTRK